MAAMIYAQECPYTGLYEEYTVVYTEQEVDDFAQKLAVIARFGMTAEELQTRLSNVFGKEVAIYTEAAVVSGNG